MIGTDASAEQLARASAHPRIEYRCERAERSSLADESVDVITIAAGLHWIELAPFYAELRRVARPGALFAAWSYGTILEIDPAVDPLVERFTAAVIGPYWSRNHEHIRSCYRDLEFPFDELTLPAMAIETEWDLSGLLGALGTWSASTSYRRATGASPTERVRDELAAAWGAPATVRPVRIPLFARIGRIDGGRGGAR